MTRGFIEKITNKSLEKYITQQAKGYRSCWKGELWESEDSEVFGFNEYIGGKAEAYEDCLKILKKFDVF